MKADTIESIVMNFNWKGILKMTNVVSLNIGGKNVTIDQQVFSAGLREAFEFLANKEEAEANLKDVIGDLAEKTGLKKGKLSKYLKERYLAKTKDTKELGSLFEELDQLLDN